MKLFGRSRLSTQELQRQAAEELDAAVARATPPTEAQRTWVLPMPEQPDLRPPRRRPAPAPASASKRAGAARKPAGADRKPASARKAPSRRTAPRTGR